MATQMVTDRTGHSKHDVRGLSSRGSAQIAYVADPNAAIDAIRRHGRRVVTFVGFSGAGYEEPLSVRNLLADVLAAFDPRLVTICSGATADGIGAIYPMAKTRGFATVGIVSAVAETNHARLSDAVDTIYVIEDQDWGGRRRDGTLSPTSVAMAGAADEIIAIGGGDIARDEVEAAIAAHKPVRYVAADMNHAAGLEKARRSGEAVPPFQGSVHQMFRG
jgi:acyl-CoA synthetase (AMP-forming)/AMP-acid ligase II